MGDSLQTWLEGELKRRGWSHSELARRAGVSQFAVSSVISGNRNAGCDFCIKIAQALGESPISLLRLAEILPPASENSTTQELIDLIKNLSEENQQELLDYARFKFQQQHKD